MFLQILQGNTEWIELVLNKVPQKKVISTPLNLQLMILQNQFVVVLTLK